MREIEFRVFDKIRRKMYPVEKINLSNKWFIYWVEDCATDYISKIDDDNIMQYTGHKDKNGTKIFEGDIVKDILGDIAVIVYKEKYSAFVADKWETGYALWFDKNIEVIGNIYDNPELLTHQHEDK